MRVLVAGVVVFQILILYAMSEPRPVSFDYVTRLGLSGGSMKVIVRTPFHSQNGGLDVAVDNGEFRTASWEQMDCHEPVNDGPPPPGECRGLRDLWFKGLPSGHYTVTATLYRRDRTRYEAVETACFAGSDVICGGSD